MHGSIIKPVQCQCGCSYTYRMERFVDSTYCGFAWTQKSAQAKGEQRAESELHRRLQEEVEACPCPQCGALTPEMEWKLERDRRDHIPQCLQLVLVGLVLGGIAMAQGHWTLTELTRRTPGPVTIILCLIAAVGPLLFMTLALLGTGLGLAALWQGYRVEQVDALTVERTEGAQVVWVSGLSVLFLWARFQIEPPDPSLLSSAPPAPRRRKRPTRRRRFRWLNCSSLRRRRRPPR